MWQSAPLLDHSTAIENICGATMYFWCQLQGVFFTGPPLKKTKSKFVLEYPDWASPGLPKKVKVHGVGLPQYRKILQTGPPQKSMIKEDLNEYRGGPVWHLKE